MLMPLLRFRLTAETASKQPHTHSQGLSKESNSVGTRPTHTRRQISSEPWMSDLQATTPPPRSHNNQRWWFTAAEVQVQQHDKPPAHSGPRQAAAIKLLQTNQRAEVRIIPNKYFVTWKAQSSRGQCVADCQRLNGTLLKPYTWFRTPDFTASSGLLTLLLIAFQRLPLYPKNRKPPKDLCNLIKNLNTSKAFMTCTALWKTSVCSRTFRFFFSFWRVHLPLTENWV